MGEHYARSQQSRTKRNTGINGARSDSTASRRYLRIDHRDGALTASYQNLASRPRLSSADLHIVRAEAERLPVDHNGSAIAAMSAKGEQCI